MKCYPRRCFKQSKAVREKWVLSPLFYCREKGTLTTVTTGREAIEREIERQLQTELPEVDLREVQVIGSGDAATLRVVIDHPDGVNHDLCVATTRSLERAGILERYGVEVWSPGPEPPLRTLEHYRAALGLPVSLKVSEDETSRSRSLSGTLTAVESDRVAVTTPDGPRWVALTAIRRGRVTERSEA